MTSLLLALSAAVAAAQDTAVRDSARFEPVDRIVAIVGSIAIPLSRVDEGINLMRARGEPIPANPAELAALRRQIVEDLINEELLVIAARADTAIKVDDTEVQAQVEETMRRVRQQFRSDVDFERQMRASGFGTVEEYRRWLADQSRRDILQNTLMQKLRQEGKLREVQPTEREMRDAFERIRQQQEESIRPASITFRQIVIRPRPDTSALIAAFQLADSLAQAIRAGADFGAVARLHSGDSASRAQGGELGWFRRGNMVLEFERVAFSLRPGYVSNPVLTPYGYHLIQVQRSEPAEVQARHILIPPEITEANQQAALGRAEAVAQALKAGGSFDSLVRVHHDPLEQTLVENVVRDSLPPEYAEAIGTSGPGVVAGPLTLRQAGRTMYAVIRIESERPAGPYTFEEVKDRLRSQLASQGAIQRYLADLRRRVYVNIRLEP